MWLQDGLEFVGESLLPLDGRGSSRLKVHRLTTKLAAGESQTDRGADLLANDLNRPCVDDGAMEAAALTGRESLTQARANLCVSQVVPPRVARQPYRGVAAW